MRVIPLTKGQFALIDDKDYDTIINYPHPWRAEKNRNMVYACSYQIVNGRPSTIRMHTLILLPPKHKQVHHINRNGLDNRRANLKALTQRKHRRGWKIEFHIFNRKIVLAVI